MQKARRNLLWQSLCLTVAVAVAAEVAVALLAVAVVQVRWIQLQRPMQRLGPGQLEGQHRANPSQLGLPRCCPPSHGAPTSSAATQRGRSFSSLGKQ